MKTRILTIAILLFTALTALSGNKMGNLFDQVKSLPYANYIHQKLDKSKSKGQGAIEGIKSIETVKVSIDKSTYETLWKEITQGDYSPYESVIEANDNEEVVKIFTKAAKKKIVEVVIVELGKDEISLVKLKGNLKSEMFNK